MQDNLSESAGHLEIAGRRVGPTTRAFVVAEIGVNHDGRVDLALRLVEAARRCGADAVKLQLFDADRLMHPTARPAEYQRQAGETDVREMLRRYALGDEQVRQVTRAARDAGLAVLATPFSPEDVARVRDLGMDAVKLASPDLVNPLLLDRAASLGLPVLASTGGADAEEVRWAAARLRSAGVSFGMLHCVSAYPTPPAEAHVAWVTGLRELSGGAVVGYSDHTPSELAGAVAVAAGARVLEKHLTYSRVAQGPDHAASADPSSLARYVMLVREVETLLGAQAHRSVRPIENDVRRVSRQSLVSAADLPAGTTLGPEHLTCQRPGTGIPVRQIDRVVGMRLARDVPAGAMLDWFDFASRDLPRDSAEHRRVA